MTAPKMQPGTPLPWRIGDAAHGVFGPPNGRPAPEMVADVRYAANCRFIVHAANAYPALVAALKRISRNYEDGQTFIAADCAEIATETLRLLGEQ